MYDTLTTSYTFSCPIHGETHVRLSRFRRLEQLPGAQHPAVFRVEFECGCGEDHPGLVTHEDLDWAPLGLHDDTQYVNLMTSRVEALAGEFGELAASRIKKGEWPWSFFCWPEERPRPVFPSAFKLLAPAPASRSVFSAPAPGPGPRSGPQPISAKRSPRWSRADVVPTDAIEGTRGRRAWQANPCAWRCSERRTSA